MQSGRIGAASTFHFLLVKTLITLFGQLPAIKDPKSHLNNYVAAESRLHKLNLVTVAKQHSLDFFFQVPFE